MSQPEPIPVLLVGVSGRDTGYWRVTTRQNIGQNIQIKTIFRPFLDTNSNDNPRAPINYAGISEVVRPSSGPLTTVVKGSERGLYQTVRGLMLSGHKKAVVTNRIGQENRFIPNIFPALFLVRRNTISLDIFSLHNHFFFTSGKLEPSPVEYLPQPVLVFFLLFECPW